MNRPRIHLRAPRARAGEPITAVLIVDADEPLDREQLSAELIGRAHLPSGRRTIVTLPGSIGGPERLVGRERIPVRFQLPPHLPPTYAGRTFRMDYRIAVRASIAWWPDARGEWNLDVAASPEAPLDGERIATAGEILEITCALTQSGPIAVHLLGFEHPTGGDRTLTYRFVYPVRGATGAHADAALQIPGTIWSSFRSSFGNLSWQLVPISLGVHEAGPAIPIHIRYPLRAHRALVAAPLPDPDVARLWGGLATDFGLTYHDGRITGEVAAAALTVQREPRGSAVQVRAALAYRSLGLGVVVEQRREGEPSRGLRLDAHLRDFGYYIDSREPLQARFLLSHLNLALGMLPQVSLTDTRAEIGLIDSGRNPSRMRLLLHHVISLAAAIEQAREALPPPFGAPPLDQWIALARHLDGKVTRGDCSVVGTLGGAAVAVLPSWRGPPTVSLCVTPPYPMGAAWRSTQLAESALPLAARAALQRAGRGSLAVSATTLVLDHIPMPIDPGTLLGTLSALVELCGHLRESAGPYR